MEYAQHISLSERDGYSVVAVDDQELLDYLDDFFTERDIHVEFISNQANSKDAESYCLYFDPSITSQFLLHQLHEIPVAEIERIHAFNKPKKLN